MNFYDFIVKFITETNKGRWYTMPWPMKKPLTFSNWYPSREAQRKKRH